MSSFLYLAALFFFQGGFIMNTVFFTATEVSRLLKISKALSYRWIADGKIRSLRVGRCVRVRQEDLEAFIADNTVGGQPPLGKEIDPYVWGKKTK
jgi:excisionase family DNA binding protein